MNLLIALFLILFEAMPEGLYDRGKKTIVGLTEFAYRAVVTLIIFAWATGWIVFYPHPEGFLDTIIGYVLFRFALFDFVYNAFAGNNLFYIGTTKIYDKFFGWFFKLTKFPEESFLFITKLIALLIGIVWLLRY